MENQIIQNKTYNKTQVKTINKALLIAAFGFAIIGLLGYLWSWLFSKYTSVPTTSLLVLVGVILILISSISFIFIQFRIDRIKSWKIIFFMGLYCLGESFGFGLIFAIYSLETISLGFLFSALIFFICFLVGSTMSIKATFTLGKFVMISSIIMLIMIIPFSILMTIFWNNFWVNTLTYSLFAIFTLIYVVFDLSVIFKTSQFLDLNDNSLLKTNITLLFGFRLLVDFVTIFWYVISFLQRTR